MLENIVYLVLAALGLGLLIFIHELGHYYMARHVGMTVEAFAIGFGKPLYTWTHRGVKWHICCLPFGGYVKIAGMEKQGGKEPHEIKGGFYSKTPWQRIKVAAMGPFINIAFAFFAFSALWVAGGRDKPFHQLTHILGWVDPHSKIFKEGVRPGDQIHSYDGRPYQGYRDLAYAAILDGKDIEIRGDRINYQTHARTPFSYTLNGDAATGGYTLGTLLPASYLIYDKMPHVEYDLVARESGMAQSGIQPGDRLLWADGSLLFSQAQLSALINEPRALITVQRGDKVFLTRLPRLRIADLRLSPAECAEIDDWQHAAGLKAKVQNLYFIPYNLTPDACVESPVPYIDERSKEQPAFKMRGSNLEIPLLPGDKILAVDGVAIASAGQFLAEIQTRRILMIVERCDGFPPIPWNQADKAFEDSIRWEDLGSIVCSIGNGPQVCASGNLRLLAPVVPRRLSDFSLPAADRERIESARQAYAEKIRTIKDPAERAAAERAFEDEQKKLKLGVLLRDRTVVYNPPPGELFTGVFEETWQTLASLIAGYLNPKWLAGPVGIVQVIHHGWAEGVKEALFWMGVISLNLGILNLLPLPVLDGGHICFSLVEAVTKKPIKAKTMERLILPFLVLLVAFLLFATYQDLARLFRSLF
jgi:regulator of sigma E protease